MPAARLPAVVPETIAMEADMGNPDETKGRIKEAAGDLTGDKDLKREGKLDRAEGKLKDAVDTARDKVGDAADDDRDRR
jgi:uncharacterized protein YjbJ (UPF0337 family)